MEREPGQFKNIEDYGIIGNLETCALVAHDGSVDWLCLPELGSPSLFAALLDTEKGGSFTIQPVDKFRSFQSYGKNTNVLVTHFLTAFGEATVTDFMPVRSHRRSAVPRVLLRKVETSCPDIRFGLRFVPRFNYARTKTAVRAVRDGVSARGGKENVFLQMPVPFVIKNRIASASFAVKKNRPLWFALTYGRSPRLTQKQCETFLVKTKEYWAGWAGRNLAHKKIFKGPLYDIVVRSGLVLKLLTNPSTGSIAAAATTSLPEQIGGVRNWDYRFAWIRDASFTAQALFHLGHVQEGKDFIRWIESVIKQDKDPARFLIMYGLHGQTNLTEKKMKHLSGYKGSAPVRIGNDAYRQKQLDIYGELVNAIYETSRYGRKITGTTWTYVRNIVNYVCTVWKRKDSGIWEVRGGERHFVYSKLMCWVAVDRGIQMAGTKRDGFTLSDWENTREEIKQAILARGFSRKLNSFVQSFGSEQLDASNLLIPLVGFLPGDDPRVQGTINAVLKKLTTQGAFVRRYDTEDGLPGDEGAFLICTFWLIKALLLSGRREEAKKIFANILTVVSPTGLLAEEADIRTHTLLGNFPQAFSHIGLINCALYMGVIKGEKHRGPKPMGLPGS